MIRLAAILVLLAAPLAAHEWYSPACCDNRDCAPIPREAVKATPLGWHVVLRHGDHPMIPEGMAVDTIVPYDNLRPSQDADFHACIVWYEGLATPYVRCLYLNWAA